MPKQLIDDSIWAKRLRTAEKYKKEWENLFKCEILNEYYEGRQWSGQNELKYNPYVINKVYETIQIKIANFIPTKLEFLVHSRAGNEDDIAAAAHSAQLKEDVLNTVTQDPDNNFVEEAEQVYKDSFFRFGIFETGYSADWVDNPRVPKPLLGKDTSTTLTTSAQLKVKFEPPELPQNERVYFKHIPARTFHIGGNDHKYLNRCGWVGYYEFVDRQDLLSMKKLLNRDKLERAYVTGDADEPDVEGLRDEKSYRSGDTLKIWHIWDLKAQMRLLVVDDPCVTVYQKKYTFLPLTDLRPDRRLITNGFYPIPPAYHWLSLQDEFNETREQLRAHRRRFVRKFQVVENAIDDEEIEKFENGPDGALVKVKRENAIGPIQTANLGPEEGESIELTNSDFDKISGTSGNERGVSDRGTATEATIVNNRTSVREGKERDRIVKFFSTVGRHVLLIVREKFTGKTLAKLTAPEGESFLGSVQANGAAYRYVTSEDLKDGYDFKIDVDVTSMSVVAAQDEKKKLLEYLSILTQFPMVAFSPYLVREIAYRCGYRNEKAIAEFQQMALLMELARMSQLQSAAQGAQAQQQQVPQNGNAPQQIAANATPPDGEQIRNQLTNQLGMTQ